MNELAAAVRSTVKKDRVQEEVNLLRYCGVNPPFRVANLVFYKYYKSVDQDLHIFDNGQSNIVSRRPRRLACFRIGRRRTVSVFLTSEGPSGPANIIIVRRTHARYRV